MILIDRRWLLQESQGLNSDLFGEIMFVTLIITVSSLLTPLVKVVNMSNVYSSLDS